MIFYWAVFIDTIYKLFVFVAFTQLTFTTLFWGKIKVSLNVDQLKLSGLQFVLGSLANWYDGKLASLYELAATSKPKILTINGLLSRISNYFLKQRLRFSFRVSFKTISVNLS